MTNQQIRTAIDELKRHVHANPIDGPAIQDLSVLLGQNGLVAEAYDFAVTAVSLLPNSLEAWLNKGNLETRAKQFDDAITSYQRAVKIDPKDTRAWFNLGNVLAITRRRKDGISALETARDLSPNTAAILASLALAYRKQNRLLDAVRTYEDAIALEPNNPHLRSNLLVACQYTHDASDALLFKQHRNWCVDYVPPPKDGVTLTKDSERTLRIGYVSGDFRHHPIGFFLLNVLEHHDRGQVDVFCFSDTRATDEMTKKLQQQADHWIESAGLSTDDFCEAIKQRDIDILIDLSGHFARNRLEAFAKKPAAVQATWAGYVGTTGLTAMDWLIADQHHAPPGYENYTTERVVRLTDNYVCYAPPDDTPDVTALPFDRNGYITFGCFNNLVKINEDALSVWAQILAAVPNSQLILKTKDLDQPDLCAQIYDAFETSNIDIKRLSLRLASDHVGLLKTYGEIDIALDPFPYSGGLTTLESLWMGVPVVTKTGRSFAGRHSTAHLTAAGLAGWITNCETDYITTAVNKASDVNALRDLRADLRQKMSTSPLCQHEEFARKLERAFRLMWDDACTPQSEKPRAVDVS